MRRRQSQVGKLLWAESDAGVTLGARLLDFLDSAHARRYWGHWKGVRILIAYTIWFVRFRNHPANRTL